MPHAATAAIDSERIRYEGEDESAEIEAEIKVKDAKNTLQRTREGVGKDTPAFERADAQPEVPRLNGCQGGVINRVLVD